MFGIKIYFSEGRAFHQQREGEIAVSCTLATDCNGETFRLDWTSELVTHTELKYTRFRKHIHILAEFIRIQNIDVHGVHIEAHGVCHIERFGADLQCVWLVLDAVQRKTLAEAEVDSKVAVAPQSVSLANITRQGRAVTA